MRVGIIAALPGELKPLIQGWRALAPKDGTRLWTHAAPDGDVWVAACSGMGADAARRAFAAAEAGGSLDYVLSIGWAGAVNSELEPGQASALSLIIDAQTGEQFELAGGQPHRKLITAARVVDASEKKRLREAYPGAVMVDMEAATIARLAVMRKIQMGCIKGVSDGVRANLPDLNPFISPRGQLRLVPFLAHVAIRPQFWKAISELNQNSSKAAKAMCSLVLEFLRENNGGKPNRTRDH